MMRLSNVRESEKVKALAISGDLIRACDKQDQALSSLEAAHLAVSQAMGELGLALRQVKEHNLTGFTSFFVDLTGQMGPWPYSSSTGFAMKVARWWTEPLASSSRG
jgi:hypothetical protein